MAACIVVKQSPLRSSSDSPDREWSSGDEIICPTPGRECAFDVFLDNRKHCVVFDEDSATLMFWMDGATHRSGWVVPPRALFTVTRCGGGGSATKYLRIHMCPTDEDLASGVQERYLHFVYCTSTGVTKIATELEEWLNDLPLVGVARR